MRLCLNMIVKNESARIERALASVAQFIDCWVITDTGSTDDTVAVIEQFFAAHKIPGHVTFSPFINWSQARNDALTAARFAKAAEKYDFDYILLMDADMELVVKDRLRFLADRIGLSYDMYQQAGAVHYQNRRLIRADTSGNYRGVTHEYVDIATAGCIEEDVAYFVDHADGSNRPEKYKRDIRLLVADLKIDPKNARSMFYLAQSYRDAGQPRKASVWYRRRVAAGGWDEEVWQAHVNLAHCLKDMGDENGYIRELLGAYQRRPARAESMYDLAHHFRLQGMNAPALAAAEAVEHLPLSRDALFVNDYVYKVGVKEEISIAAFYVPGKRRKGYHVASDLSLQAGPYGGARELARANLYHYLEPLSTFCPSFEWRSIPFVPPPGWVAMNPSVTTHNDELHCNIRCVNYRITENGVYAINGKGDAPANNTNPIETRNFVTRFESRHFIPLDVAEVMPPADMTREFPAVLGFEDMRLISWGGDLWSSSTVRQLHRDGNCEQVLTRLVRPLGVHHIYQHTSMQRMLRQPRATEKNWSPMLAGRSNSTLRFMWRPGEVVNTSGATVFKQDTERATDHISGSSQLIPWGSGYLAIVHEARCLPGSHLRYYYHRFAQYDGAGALLRFSLPFFFNAKEIEFCAGLAQRMYSTQLVISYGFKDEDARIATVNTADVEKFLCLRS